MRLTAEQIRQGMLHEDPDVRQACLEYFSGAYSSDESVMPAVIQAVEEYGLGAFPYPGSVERLAQSDATIDWLVRSIREQPVSDHVDSDEEEDEDEEYDEFDDDGSTTDRDDFRQRILRHASIRLVSRHRDEVLSVADEESREAIQRRLEFLALSPDELWQQFRSICAMHRLDDWSAFPRVLVDDLVNAIVEVGAVPIDDLMKLLQTEISDDDGIGLGWMEAFLIRASGQFRHEPVLPILVDKLRLDADLLSPELEVALIRLGTEDVVRTIAELFPHEEWHWQLFASFALGGIHSDQAIQAGLTLLQNDSIDEEIRQFLAHGLVRQFSTECLEAVANYVDSRADWLQNDEWEETFQLMKIAANLLGVDMIHRIDIWQQELDESLASSDEWPDFDDFGDEGDDDVDDFEVDREPTFAPDTVVYDTARGPERPLSLRQRQKVQEMLPE